MDYTVPLMGMNKAIQDDLAWQKVRRDEILKKTGCNTMSRTPQIHMQTEQRTIVTREELFRAMQRGMQRRLERR